MKRIYHLLCAALFSAGAVLTTSCVGDLDQYPHIEPTSATVYTSVDNYKAVLGKLYVAFTIASQQKGGAGTADLTTNKGWDYMRNYFNMQECGTDEVVYTWLAGDNMTGLTYLSWDANDLIVSDMYYRIYYNIALCNEFLRNATDDRIASFSESEQEEIRHFRAEARFLRAFAYSHAMDFFRNVPFVTEANPVGSYIPPRYTSAQIFDFVESELLAIDEDLLDRSACEYGRACRQAAYALLARLYLNAEVYTGEARWTDCITYCQRVINAGYTLERDYAKLFNADNHLRTNEIIFAFPVDATHTTSWGTTTYMVCGPINNASSFQVPADCPILPYLTRNMLYLENLYPGARCLVWSDGSTASKIMMFQPYGPEEAGSEDTVQPYEQQTGWVLTEGEAGTADARWIYYNQDGSLAKGWVEDSGKWYFLNLETGVMERSCFIQVDGKTYYMQEDGSMLTEAKTFTPAADGSLS